MIIEFNHGDDIESMLNGPARFVLVDFYATWCEPCKWLLPVLEELNLLFHDRETIVKIDSEAFTKIREKYQIRSVPTLVLFCKGKEVWRINGFLMAEDLKKKIEEFLVS